MPGARNYRKSKSSWPFGGKRAEGRGEGRGSEGRRENNKSRRKEKREERGRVDRKPARYSLKSNPTTGSQDRAPGRTVSSSTRQSRKRGWESSIRRTVCATSAAKSLCGNARTAGRMTSSSRLCCATNATALCTHSRRAQVTGCEYGLEFEVKRFHPPDHPTRARNSRRYPFLCARCMRPSLRRAHHCARCYPTPARQIVIPCKGSEC